LDRSRQSNQPTKPDPMKKTALTDIDKQVATNLYGDWLTENLLWVLKKRETLPVIKQLIRYVLSTR
jgi:hypothetical protein